jgi:hypothetical protein
LEASAAAASSDTARGGAATDEEHPEPQPAAPGTPAAEWERAMDAELVQWRFMDLVAVAELQAEERAAHSILVALTDELEAAMDDITALTAHLDVVRGAAAGRTFAERAAQPPSALVASIEQLAPDQNRICQGLLRSLEELPLRNVAVEPHTGARPWGAPPRPGIHTVAR